MAQCTLVGTEGAKRPLSDELWILGEKFSMKSRSHAIKDRVASLPWMTYRRNFPKIGTTMYQSDQGWGCMLRCGQMMLAEALLTASGGEHDGERDSGPADEGSDTWEEVGRRQLVRPSVLSLFADTLDAPYSIHNIALRGQVMGKSIGEWFGPNCMAQVMRMLTDASGQRDSGVIVHVAMDSVVCTEEIEKKAGPEWQVPLLLLIPLRLGLDSLNQRYGKTLKEMFKLTGCVGAMGGRPNAALYFVGTQDEELLYLDPHKVQVTVGPMQRHTKLSSYTPNGLERLPIRLADPSLCLGFLISSADQWAQFLDEVTASAPPEQGLFSVTRCDISSLVHGDDDFSVSDDDNDEEDVVEDEGFELISLP